MTNNLTLLLDKSFKLHFFKSLMRNNDTLSGIAEYIEEIYIIRNGTVSLIITFKLLHIYFTTLCIQYTNTFAAFIHFFASMSSNPSSNLIVLTTTIKHEIRTGIVRREIARSALLKKILKILANRRSCVFAGEKCNAHLKSFLSFHCRGAALTLSGFFYAHFSAPVTLFIFCRREKAACSQWIGAKCIQVSMCVLYCTHFSFSLYVICARWRE